MISCSDLKDQPVDLIHESLREQLVKAAWCSPSLLVLDDLDQLIPAEQEVSISTVCYYSSAFLTKAIVRLERGLVACATTLCHSISATGPLYESFLDLSPCDGSRRCFSV